jgi:myo-inositol-1(or 4)-monophosphatase
MKDCEKEMAEFAYGLTESAGAILRSERKHTAIKMMDKTSHMDIVTQKDVLIEKFITDAILQKYPGHEVLAEEGYNTGTNSNSGYTWIIDPIDGTINFCRFARDYAISIALYHGKAPVFGLIYDVAGDRMYSAEDGSIPEVNGTCLEKLSGSETKLRNAIIGMSLRTMRELNNMGTDVLDLLSRVQAHRYLGCASLELCRIASGEYDVFISSNVYTWDIAAARILITQCGGSMIVCEKELDAACARKYFVAAYRSPALWEDILQLLPYNVQCAFGYSS